MNKKFFYIVFLFYIFVLFNIALAANPFSIQYPITDLGGCSSQSDCKSYCDAEDNQSACMKWAQDNGFAPKPEKQQSDRPSRNKEDLLKDEEALANAPGGCKTPRECDAYCRVEEHLDQCLDYSVKYGYTTQEDADKIREKANKGGPGGCKSQSQCDQYCRVPEHARECMDFVVAEGKITKEEADIMVENMTKGVGKPTGKGPAEPKIKEGVVEAVLQDKAGPGGCKTMRECSAYCQGGEHMDECIAFAEQNGIMAPEDMVKAKKLIQMGGPGGCKGQQECDAFCSQPGNGELCFAFSKDNGLISDDEIKMMEKQMQIIKKLDRQAGPGGCKTKEECGSYCGDPSHIEECIDFAGKQGMLPGNAVKQMMGQTQDAKFKIRQLEEYRRSQTMEGEEENFNEDRPRGMFFDGDPNDIGPNATQGNDPRNTGGERRYIPEGDTTTPRGENFVPRQDDSGRIIPPQGYYRPIIPNNTDGRIMTPPPGYEQYRNYAPVDSGQNYGGSVPPPGMPQGVYPGGGIMTPPSDYGQYQNYTPPQGQQPMVPVPGSMVQPSDIPVGIPQPEYNSEQQPLSVPTSMSISRMFGTILMSLFRI